RHIFRPRTILYTSMWSAIGVGLVVALFVRPEIDVAVSPIRNPVYVTQSDGTIRNAYDLRLRNKHHEPRDFALSFTADAPLNLHLEGTEGIAVTVPADETREVRLYLDAAPGTAAAATERTDVRIWVTDISSGDRASAESHFNGAE
ncbi:MAG TPA: FixG Ig-like domain-containing protein, partial [Rubellimicrobium sp.]|nr:FixG Ig-like domain-containing protein [Rubellimicrobium sp.]